MFNHVGKRNKKTGLLLFIVHFLLTFSRTFTGTDTTIAANEKTTSVKLPVSNAFA